MIYRTPEQAAAIQRAGGKCEWCNLPFEPRGLRQHAFEVHHIQAKPAGGQDTEENLVVLCLDCHDGTKGGRRNLRPTVSALKQIRLRVEDAADLGELTARWRCNEAEAIRRLIREAAERERERKGAE